MRDLAVVSTRRSLGSRFFSLAGARSMRDLAVVSPRLSAVGPTVDDPRPPGTIDARPRWSRLSDCVGETPAPRRHNRCETSRWSRLPARQGAWADGHNRCETSRWSRQCESAARGLRLHGTIDARPRGGLENLCASSIDARPRGGLDTPNGHRLMCSLLGTIDARPRGGLDSFTKALAPLGVHGTIDARSRHRDLHPHVESRITRSGTIDARPRCGLDCGDGVRTTRSPSDTIDARPRCGLDHAQCAAMPQVIYGLDNIEH